MNHKIFFFLLAAIIFHSCKEGGVSPGKGGKVSVLPVNDLYMLSNQDGMKDSLVQVHRRAAEVIINNRIKTGAQTTTNALEKDNWHYEAFLKGSNMTFGSDLKGGWIDFKEQNNYSYGSFDQPLGGGKYHLDTDKNLLILVDADSRVKPQEFQIMQNGDGLVLVGQPIYTDNNMQVKLNRKAGFPVKPTSPPLQ
jgi:hypothetical protein